MNGQEKNRSEKPLDASTSPTNVDTSSNGPVSQTVAEVRSFVQPILAQPSTPPSFSGNTGGGRF